MTNKSFSLDRHLYEQAGDMLRHYGAVRVAVLSLGLPMCLSILGIVLSLKLMPLITVFILLSEGLIFGYSLTVSSLYASKQERLRQAMFRFEMGLGMGPISGILGSEGLDTVSFGPIERKLILYGSGVHLVFYLFLYFVQGFRP